MEIKIGDMIVSDTGGCGIVVDNRDDYLIEWNNDNAAFSTSLEVIKVLIKYGKWKLQEL